MSLVLFPPLKGLFYNFHPLEGICAILPDTRGLFCCFHPLEDISARRSCNFCPLEGFFCNFCPFGDVSATSCPFRDEYLSKPVQVKVGKVSSPTTNVSQVLDKVTESEKIDRLLSLLVEEASQAEKFGRSLPLTIVFVERKTRCDEVAEALVAQGLPAVALHGGHSQREREGALQDFRKGTTNILVATDVASRGLDVAGVAHVVNLDLPKAMEDYVHRIGRTGRAGFTGQATSFYTDRDMFLVAQIRKAISDAESGNVVSFATGKTARRKEREAAAAQREARNALSSVSLNDPASVSVDDKYRYMVAATTIRTEGAADDAWDD
ncbi:hypothetical protein Taro_028036 [Colocasia esculenta]|uniref:Helicase C-terminal domain-containing protein n=1 Tax=Colocasia esculenta TaxID=4460 RepID=A0A843VW22_COLES|nr:hypothetical protein [Colocasia esculenta]